MIDKTKITETPETFIASVRGRPKNLPLSDEAVTMCDILEGKIEREKVINESPDLAIRLIHIFGKLDLALARGFIEKYAQSEQYHHTAYFIAQDLEIPMQQRKAWIDPFPTKGDHYEGRRNPKLFCGNKKPDYAWWDSDERANFTRKL